MTSASKTRTAVVTGSSGGIGAATVQILLDQGWTVWGLDQIDPVIANGRFTSLRCDIADRSQMSEVAAEICSDGPLNALVNNAAVQVNKSIIETSDADWDLVFDTNVGAAFRLTRDLFPALAQGKGAVVNVASVHAVATSMNLAGYAASKGALVALTRAAAIELAIHGIRCNAVLPGAIDTPMLRAGLGRREHVDGPDGNLAELTRRTPIGYVAEPWVIAETIAFLADSERSPYTVGQTLIVDGGATAVLSTEP